MIEPGRNGVIETGRNGVIELGRNCATEPDKNDALNESRNSPIQCPLPINNSSEVAEESRQDFRPKARKSKRHYIDDNRVYRKPQPRASDSLALHWSDGTSALEYVKDTSALSPNKKKGGEDDGYGPLKIVMEDHSYPKLPSIGEVIPTPVFEESEDRLMIVE